MQSLQLPIRISVLGWLLGAFKFVHKFIFTIYIVFR